MRDLGEKLGGKSGEQHCEAFTKAAGVLLQRNQFPEGLHNLRAAVACYEAAGDRLEGNYVTANLCAEFASRAGNWLGDYHFY
jgi:hypothetical protein